MLFLKRKIGLFVVFSFLVLNLFLFSGVAAIPNGISSINEITMIENPSIGQDHNLVKVDYTQDIDKDHFQDSFKQKLVTGESSAVYEAILSLNGPITRADRLFLEKNSIEILQEYTVIYAIHVKGTAENLLKIHDLGSSLYLEENTLGHALLFDVTEDFGVRKVWQVAQGYGYIGDSNTAIAILDTGIDDTHPDSNFNVVYWQDFVGADETITGDEYATPTDKGEHGTHVASIAASKGAFSSTSIIKVQASGYLHTTNGWAWQYTWFYLSSAQTVTIYYTWEGSGSTYAGFIDSTTAWVASSYSTPDSSSPGVFSHAFSSAGWYCAMYGNYAGAGGKYFSGEVVYNTGWTNPYADGRGGFTGVAPGSNVVGLKVLDDMGIGPKDSLIAALQWLYDYGQSYNVTVVNMSIGWPTIVPSIDSSITSLVRNKGIVCVVSAGNDGTSSGGITSPGSCPDAITVGAVNKASEIAYYSSNGHSSQGFIKPDVVAPGGSFASSGSSAIRQPIIAADSNDADKAYSFNTQTKYPPRTDYYVNNYRGYQGTSMAAPFVAGLVQLVVDAIIQEEGSYTYSWETAKKIKQIICMSASEVYNIEGSISTGGELFDGDGDAIAQVPILNRNTKDYTEGWGLISVEGAIQAVTRWLSVGITEVITLSGRQYGTHVAVRQINLETKKIYKMFGDFVVGTFTDADLFIIHPDSDDFGEPAIIAQCIMGVIVTNESTIFSVPTDDTYYLVVKWVDGTYDGSCSVKISEIVSLTSHSDGDTIFSGTKLTFDVDPTDLTLLEYTVDALPVRTFDSPYEIEVPGPDGSHTVRINAQHILGPVAQITFTFTVVTDEKPVITPGNDLEYELGSTNNYISWVLEDNNPDSYEILRDGTFITGGGWTDGQNISLNVDSLSEGTYNYTMVAQDLLAHESSSSIIVTVVTVEKTSFFWLFAVVLLIVPIIRKKRR